MTGHPLIRIRSGTGQFYADNRRRLPRSAVRRMPRGASGFPRGDNQKRPWLAETADEPVPLANVSLDEIIAAARQAAHLLIDLLQDVGSYVQRCRRRREPMPREIVDDMGDLLDWYLVLHAVGVVDSRGVWLADSWWNRTERGGS